MTTRSFRLQWTFVFGLTIAGPANSQDYLFNRLAADEIRDGWNNENFTQMREGAHRCGAVIVLAGEFGWIQKSQDPQYHYNLSYKGILNAAVYDWYINTPESEISPATVQQARAEETDQFMFTAMDYTDWLSSATPLTLQEMGLRMTDDDDNPPLEKLPAGHIFRTELTECYKVGRDLNDMFGS